MRWWFRQRPSSDFDAEIESHLAMETERLVRSGVSRTRAEHAARRVFGNVTHAREHFREARRWASVERATRCVTLAARTLFRSPGFSSTVVLTLALGIGATTAIFTLVYSVAMRPLPVRGADRLVNVYQQFHGHFAREVNGFGSQISYPEFLTYSRNAHALQSSAVYTQSDFASSDAPDGSVRGAYVSCGYFQTLQARIIIGRSFRSDECGQLGSPRVAVISYHLWQSQFGGDRSVIGRMLDLNRIPVNVIGVTEAGFAGTDVQSTDSWVPVTLEPTLMHGADSLVTHDASWMTMIGRLAPDATINQLRAELSAIARGRNLQFPGRTTTVIVTPASYLNFPEAHRQGAAVVGLVAALGLLIVVITCANIMNLLLARAIARRREIAVRVALGATRRRLIVQLVVESLLMGMVGGVVGASLVYLLPGIIERVSPMVGLQINFTPNTSVLLFAVLTSLAAAVAFGLAPALHATSVDLAAAMKGLVSFGSRQIKSSRLRNMVVGVQVAASTLLLVLAALFFHAAQHASGAELGYTTHGVTSYHLNLAQLGYDDSRTSALYSVLTERLSAIPGVDAVGLASQLPLLGRSVEEIRIPDPHTGTWSTGLQSSFTFATSGYLKAIGVRVIRGVGLGDRVDATSETRAVVSASLAEMLWPRSDVLGKRIRVANREYTVTGVAANTRMVSLTSDTDPFVYLSAPPAGAGLVVVVRTRGSPTRVDQAIRRIVREFDPQVLVRSEQFENLIAAVTRPARIAAAVGGTAGALALLLALVGIYGIVAYAVSERTREIAIRLALGGTHSHVIAFILRQGARPLVGGVLAGAAVAGVASQLLRSALLGISPLDPIAYIEMGCLLLLTSLVAMLIPAWRAANLDLVLTLRQD
jgi:predicted permease